MECPHCGHSIILGDDTCEQCGADLINSDPPRPAHGRLHEAILEDPISQLNAPQPILLEKTDTVDKAVRRMKKMRFGSVLVVEKDRLVGIFSEHDLLKKFAGRESELSKTTLGEVMTPDPQYLHEDDTLAQVLNRMAVGGYRHIPVVDEEKPRGFISVRGLLSYLADNCL